MYSKTQPSGHTRIELTAEMFRKFFQNIFHGTVSELCADKDLPYTLVYNLVHGRIKSLSAEEYKIIFGEEPPYQDHTRVDGELFRGMVRLWLFLNDYLTEADLYKEFYPDRGYSKVDYRIFSGDIRTIEARLEKMMEQKFLEQGLDRSEIEAWIEALYDIDDEDRIPYKEIKPILEFLEEASDVNPSRVLNQWAFRYESGELKTVPKRIYDSALKLKERTEEALASDSRFETERIREGLYGKRKGLTLFSEVEEELEFLHRYGGKSPNAYLGRSVSAYRKSKLKRIAYWRAQRISSDCLSLIGKRTDVKLLSLPRSYSKRAVWGFISFLSSYLKKRVTEDKSGIFEKDLLRPRYYDKEQYETSIHGFTSIDEAASSLGMSRIAFDLLLAQNCELIRRIGKYKEKWYLPDLYLKELKDKDGFHLVKAKYESLAIDTAKGPFSPDALC